MKDDILTTLSRQRLMVRWPFSSRLYTSSSVSVLLSPERQAPRGNHPSEAALDRSVRRCLPAAQSGRAGPGLEAGLEDTADPTWGQDSVGCFRVGRPLLPLPDAPRPLRLGQRASCISLPNGGYFVSASPSRESLGPWGPLAGKGHQEKM